MCRLLLLRHAKSDWSVNLPDDQRQLNKRGRKTAPVMGKYMAKNNLVPDLVLCSPAVRASETWRLASKALPDGIEVKYVDAIYDFSGGSGLVEHLRRLGGDAKTLLVVGHNPSMEGLAHLLVSSGDPESLEQMSRKYPTAALAVIDFHFDNWSRLAPSSGHLERFVRPKDLAAE